MNLRHFGSGAVRGRHIARTLHTLAASSSSATRRTVSSTGTEHSRMVQVIDQALVVFASVRGWFSLLLGRTLVAPFLDVLESEEPEEREEEQSSEGASDDAAHRGFVRGLVAVVVVRAETCSGAFGNIVGRGRGVNGEDNGRDGTAG